MLDETLEGVAALLTVAGGCSVVGVLAWSAAHSAPEVPISPALIRARTSLGCKAGADARRAGASEKGMDSPRDGAILLTC